MSASFGGCCCCLFLLFTFLFLLFLATLLILFLALKPQNPHFDLQQVTIQTISITPTPNPSPSTSAALSLTILLAFVATNDNKVGIKYDESRFNVMYKGIPLGRGSVIRFYQPAHSVSGVETVVVVDRVSLLQGNADDLLRDTSLYDRVLLRVLGDVISKIRVLGFTSPGVQISVDCEIVISPKKQELTDKRCGFGGVSV